MKLANPSQVELKQRGQPVGQDRPALAHAFAFANEDLVVAEIDVLDAQAEEFHQSQTGTVEQLRHQTIIVFQLPDHPAGLVPGEDDGELRWAPDAFDTGDELELSIEDLLKEEKEGAERLILRGGGDVEISREVTEKGSDLGLTHLVRMAFAMEDYEATDPIQVGLFRPEGVMFNPQMPADAIEEARIWWAEL